MSFDVSGKPGEAQSTLLRPSGDLLAMSVKAILCRSTGALVYFEFIQFEQLG